MSMESPKRLRRSVALSVLLMGVLGISACQPSAPPEADIGEGAEREESVPMSAEPAEPTDVAMDVDDLVTDDTIADELIVDDLGTADQGDDGLN